MSKVEIRQTGTSNVVVASEVASPFATVAVSAANSANAAWDSFRSVYYGAFATAPSADPLGNPISVGDLYFDTTISALMVWGGSAWQTYNPATISTAALTDWPAAVSVTELGYLDGVTGSIQAQIDNKAPASRTIAAGTGLTGGGDLSADRNLAAVTLPQSDWTAGSSNVDAVVSPADISAAITALTPPPPPGLGVGQTWSNPVRSNNVAYQNTTGRPIFVVISVYTNRQVYVSADAVTWVTLCSVGANPSESGTGFVVPNGYFYKTNGKRTWGELR